MDEQDELERLVMNRMIVKKLVSPKVVDPPSLPLLNSKVLFPFVLREVFDVMRLKQRM